MRTLRYNSDNFKSKILFNRAEASIAMGNKVLEKAEAPLTELIKALGVDPCMLMVATVVVASFGLIYFTFKHHEKMEDKRIEQFNGLVKILKKGK